MSNPRSGRAMNRREENQLEQRGEVGGWAYDVCLRVRVDGDGGGGGADKRTKQQEQKKDAVRVGKADELFNSPVTHGQWKYTTLVGKKRERGGRGGGRWDTPAHHPYVNTDTKKKENGMTQLSQARGTARATEK